MVRLNNSLAERVGDAMSVERGYSVAKWAWWAMPSRAVAKWAWWAMPSRAGWAIELHS